ncbi:MAG TPA: hypothetical protein VGB85_14555 [Nannocystis sp.]
MLANFLLSVVSTAGPASSGSAAEERLEKDKAIIRVLDRATDDYKLFVSGVCRTGDHDTADLAARAAAMSEERAIRTRDLTELVDPADRAEYERAAAELFIEAADFWLRALTCRPSRSLYLEHAELPLLDAERLTQGDAGLSAAITERRKRIALYRRREVERPEVSPTCRQGDLKSTELVALHAAQTRERAIQARTPEEAATLAGAPDPARPATGESGVQHESKAAHLALEAAGLWVRAWECHRVSGYLDNATLLLAEAEHLTPGDALVRRIRGLRRTIALHRAKLWTDRFSLRIELGYGSGRLAWLKHQTYGSIYEYGYRAHGGAYFGLSAMLRAPPRTGPVNLLFGPYYTYWRAAQHSFLPETKSANVHEFGAKTEVSVGFTPKVAKFFTLHPSLEVGLQYINFDDRPIPGQLVDPEYIDMAGGTVGMSLGVCFIYSSVCAMSRVHSVPQAWKQGIPTLRGGIAIDLVRLTQAVLERKSLRLQAK